MRTLWRNRALGFTLTLILTTFLALQPAHAAADDPWRAAVQMTNASPTHCVLRALPFGRGSPITPVCFATFSRAIEYATAGALRLPPDTPTGRIDASEMPRGLRPFFQTVIGIDYSDANWSGSTLTWYVDNPNGCNDGTVYQASSMPSGWNDVVSSAVSYQGCYYWYHYEHDNWGGTRLECGLCSSMGVMNDKTSSEKWSSYPLP